MNDLPPPEPTQSPATKPRPPARWYRATSASSIGIEIAVAVCVPTLAGRWADERWPDFAPFGMIIGLVVGCGGAIRSVQRSLKDYKRELKNPSDPEESLLVPGSMGSFLQKVGQDSDKKKGLDEAQEQATKSDESA